MKKVILLGTSHSIQRGEKSPEQFRAVIEEEYIKINFVGIAEEIDGNSVYVAETFCSENQLKYLCMEPDEQERKDRGIPLRHIIISRIIDKFEGKYPEIRMWPSNPDEGTLPSEVWESYFAQVEASDRAREAIWFERLTAFDVWPVLCICGANHFGPFDQLLRDAGIQVVRHHHDWEPTSL